MQKTPTEVQLENSWLHYHYDHSLPRPKRVPKTPSNDIVKRLTCWDARREYITLRPKLRFLFARYGLKFTSLSLGIKTATSCHPAWGFFLKYHDQYYLDPNVWHADREYTIKKEDLRSNPGIVREYSKNFYSDVAGFTLAVNDDHDILWAGEAWVANHSKGYVWFCTPRQYEEFRKNVVSDDNPHKNIEPWADMMPIGGDFCLQIDRGRKDTTLNVHCLHTLHCNMEEFITRYILQRQALAGYKTPGITVTKGNNRPNILEKLTRLQGVER